MVRSDRINFIEVEWTRFWRRQEVDLIAAEAAFVGVGRGFFTAPLEGDGGRVAGFLILSAAGIIFLTAFATDFGAIRSRAARGATGATLAACFHTGLGLEGELLGKKEGGSDGEEAELFH